MGNKTFQGDININGQLLINGQPLPEMTALTDAEIEALLSISLPPIDLVLANNSWHTIRLVCEAGLAHLFWNLGDVKTVTTNDATREWRIVDMQGLYGKHVVFAPWTLSANLYVFKNSPKSNDYSNSDLIAQMEPNGAIYNDFINDELNQELTNTTVSVATNGQSTTLINVTQKIFLPAEKELTATRLYSVQQEFDALTTYQYFANNDNNASRIRYSSTPGSTYSSAWYSRSPTSGHASRVVVIKEDGSFLYADSNNTRYIVPCFAF